MTQPARVVHVITGLGLGGAESMLSKLVLAMDSTRFQSSVISLTGLGPVGQKLAAAGISVRVLGLDRRFPNPLKLLQLSRWLKEEPPALIQTWMYHADLIGGLSARISGNIPVVWNIRHSTFEPATTKLSTRVIVRLLALLSGSIPAAIVSCSNRAAGVHTRLGYRVEKIVTIPNGFDLGQFRPDLLSREDFRAMLSLSPSTPLIGMVARFDPQKDHANFIAAAQKFSMSSPETHFLLCGKGCDWNNLKLVEAVDKANLRQCFHLLGEQQDLPRLYAGLDLFTLSSAYGEAFPNVVGEAMACGLACVVTDVGDSAEIVGEDGLVVSPRNPGALADAWGKLLALPADQRRALGERARTRIRQNYSIERIAERYQSLYEQIMGERLFR